MSAAFLIADKPAGITSHDVVAMLRAVTGIKKVGHTGTLDPFATGVLPLALGGATKLIQYLDEDLKVYDAVVQLGAATDTGDPTGVVVREAPVPELEAAAVEQVLEGFKGVRMQEPPRHSAVKVKGKPLYSYARAGKDVRAQPRPIRIDSIELLELSADRLRVVITCGKGTYARVLAEEIGEALGTEGHLIELRRLRSGPFGIDEAVDLSAISEMVAGRQDWQAVLRPQRGEERVPWRPRQEVMAGLRPHLVRPMEVLGHLPKVELPPALEARFLNGAAPPPPPTNMEPGTRYLVVAEGRLLGICEQDRPAPRALLRFAV